ncbi:MAG: PEGA domain-containing protein [bacterium]
MKTLATLVVLLLPYVLTAQNSETVQRKTVLKDGTEVTTDVTIATQVKTPPTTETAQKKYKTLILVDNRAGQQYNNQVIRFESQVAANLGPTVLGIISREDVIKAQKIYDAEHPTASTADSNAKLVTTPEAMTALRKVVFTAIDPVSGTATTTEDWKTLRNSTALNMARTIGAELILAVAIDSMSTEIRTYSGTGVRTKTKIITLRGSYRLMDPEQGTALISAPLKTSRTYRESDSIQIDVSDSCAELLEKASDQIAKDVLAKANAITIQAPKESIEIKIASLSKDLQGNDLTLPDIRVTEDGKIISMEKPLSVEISATVELDGILIGTTPCSIKTRSGIHKVRLIAPGFADYVANMTASDEMRQLNFTLQMTDAGFQRWKEVRLFLLNLGADKKFVEAALQRDRKLTDAQVEYIKGQAEMYRNSNFRITKLPNTVVTGARNWSLFDILNF